MEDYLKSILRFQILLYFSGYTWNEKKNNGKVRRKMIGRRKGVRRKMIGRRKGVRRN
jgi:hypothetical protein